jgi:hypothetical protein
MHDSLTKHAAQLARLAMMIRIGLESAESAIPGINDLLAELATLGVTDFQVEGPAIYCRPAGPSSAYDDSFVVYQPNRCGWGELLQCAFPNSLLAQGRP